MFARFTALLGLMAMAAMASYAQSAPQQPDPSQLSQVRDAAGAPLTLDEAFGLAAQNNPLLRAARANADASAGALMQAGARPNPEISFLQEGVRGGDRTSTYLVNQPLELGGKRRARLNVASYGREVALASFDGSAAALRADVFAAFYGVLAAQRQLQVARESADIAVRSAELAEKRVRAGKVSPVEATKARIAASAAQIEVAAAGARLSEATAKLVNVTGSALTGERPASGDMQSVPAVGALQRLLARVDEAPLARAARAQMLRSDALVSVERTKRIPNITLSAGMKRVFTAGIPDNQVVIGVSIPLPLFDTNKGAALESAHQAERAAAEFDSEKAALRLELTRAYASYERAVQEARRLELDILPGAREALNAMTRGYELGKFALIDVLDTQRTFYQEQSRYTQALMDAHVAYADIMRVVGDPDASPYASTMPAQ